jgi:hypothetical protein
VLISGSQFMLSVGKLAHLSQVQEGGEVDNVALDSTLIDFFFDTGVLD